MMTQAQLATASLNDIVFDGRNKEYGAYELRAAYERHVRQALGWASLVLLLLLLYPVVSRLMADAFPAPPVVKTNGKVELIDVMPVKPPMVVPPVTTPPPVAQPAAAPPRLNTVQYTEYEVAKSPNEATVDVPNVDELVNANVGAVTVTNGMDATGLEPLINESNSVVNETVAAPEIYISVEQYPEVMPGGGLPSIVAAIQKAARYPAIDLRNGVEGRIFATFIVNSEGDIVEAKIMKGLSATLDAETLRAISTLPKLRPAKQNGKAVNVSFTVPISFKIQ